MMKMFDVGMLEPTPLSTRFFGLFFNPFGRSVSLTIIFSIFLYNIHDISGSLIVLSALLINIIISILQVVMAIIKQNRSCLTRLVVQAVFVTLFPFLTITLSFYKRWDIDLASMFLAVHVVEPILLREVKDTSNNSFRFRQYNFGKILGCERKVVFDESDQVLLPPESRSQNWWNTAMEDECYYDNCFSRE